MAYIGFNPSQQAVTSFSTKVFTGDGTTTTFTLDQAVPGANEANVDVYVENVHQNPIDAYTIGGVLNNQLIFSEAPATGASIYVIHKGESTYQLIPSTGSVNVDSLDPVLRNFTVDTFTGNGSNTSFTLSQEALSPNAILVMVDGITQTASVNYSVSGTTLSFGATAPDNGSSITVVHLGFSSGIKSVMDRSISPLKLSTGGPSWDSSSNLTVSGRVNSASGYFGPSSSSLATTKADMQTYSALTVKPHNNNSTHLEFATLGGGDCVGLQVSNYSNVANWHLALSPFGGFVGIGTGANSPAAPLHVAKVGTVGGSLGSSRGSNATSMVYFDNVAQNTTTYIEVASAPTQQSGILFAKGAATGAYGLLNYDNNTDTMSLYTNSSARMSIDSNGIVNIPYGQIKFPAVANISSDPNTLDDYEEGSFLPNIRGGDTAGVTTWTSREGYYTKIGRMVFVFMNLRWTNQTGTGELQVDNLPFTVLGYAGYGAISYNSGLSFTSGYYPALWANSGSATLRFWQANNGSVTPIPVDTSVGEIHVTFIYTTSQ